MDVLGALFYDQSVTKFWGFMTSSGHNFFWLITGHYKKLNLFRSDRSGTRLVTKITSTLDAFISGLFGSLCGTSDIGGNIWEYTVVLQFSFSFVRAASSLGNLRIDYLREHTRKSIQNNRMEILKFLWAAWIINFEKSKRLRERKRKNWYNDQFLLMEQKFLEFFDFVFLKFSFRIRVYN